MTSFLGFRSLSDVLGLGRRPILREFAIKNTTNKQVNRHLTTNPGIRKGKPSSQDDCYRYRLCQKCDDFLKWDKLRLRRVEENTFFHHYTKSSDLKASAAKRCHLCLLIYDHLLKSRRPEGETELPERQVRLTIKYPDFASGALFLNASIKPADLSTAGLHDLEQVDYHKVTKILLPDFDEYIRDLFPLGAAMEVLDVETLVVVQDLASERAKYFQSGMEISADEFYALALPFHTCDLQLHTVFPVVDAYLSKSTIYDDRSTSSDSSFCMARFWLEFCREGHRHCTSARNEHDKPPLLPKRVLDLADHSLSGPLLVCPTLGSRAPYVTLSHCWGKKKLIRTLEGNISRYLTTGIPWSELPQTFQDALDITHRLGFRYLWINSLCIIQDSTEDWKEESAKMADIYRNADLCISALDSQDSSEGIYRSRDGLLHSPCKLWDEPPPGLCIPSGIGGLVYAFADQNSSPSSSEGPLAHRAWVLQEELMSGRRLIYGKDILYWSCLTMEVSTREPHLVFGTPDAKLSRGRYDWHQYFQAAIGELLDNMEMSGSDMKKLYQCWLCIIENYSQRGLTKGSDKLTALAGLASEFGRVTQDSYLSGLWGRYLWRQLLWSVASEGAPLFNKEVPSEIPEPWLVPDFLGPTWSWSRIDGRIVYFPQYPLDNVDDHEVMVEILSSSCNPSSPREISNHYSGLLSLRGMVVRAIAKPFSPDSKKVETFSAISNISEPTPEQLDLHKAQMDAIMAERSQVYSKHSGPEREKGLDVPDLHHCSWTRYRQFINDSYYAPRHEIEMNVDSAFSSIQKPDSTYPGHPVVDFDRGEQVGYWAPDLPSSQETLEVTCLAISSNRQFVFCIAMEPVNEYENRFRRIGLVFWGKSAWERMVLETGQSLVDLE